MGWRTLWARIFAARRRRGLEALEYVLRWVMLAWLVAFVVGSSLQAMPIQAVS